MHTSQSVAHAHPCYATRTLARGSLGRLPHTTARLTRIDIQHRHRTLRTVHQPSRARLQAAHCPAARGSPHRAELGSTGRVTEPNRVRRGRPSPSRSQVWTSIQTDRSAALLSCVLPHPAPDAAVLPPLCHAPIHACIRASSAVECEPFVTRMHSRIIRCRVRAVRYSEWHAPACCIRSRRRGSLTTAPPRLAPSPTTSSLVLPRAHGRLHEHARGTPALPTRVPTLTTARIPARIPALTTALRPALIPALTTALIPALIPVLTTALIPAHIPVLTTAVLTRAARRARSGPTCSPQVRAACDHPTQLSGAARGKQPTSAAGGRGRTVHQSARMRPST